METIIVSRHSGAVEWLRSQGIVGEMLNHVTDVSQIAGKRVVGASATIIAGAWQLWQT